MPFIQTVIRRVSPLVFWVLVAVYIPLCMMLLGVKWLLLPWVDQYRPWVEQTLSSEIGRPVQIDRLEAHWKGLTPQLQVSNFRVLQPDGQVGFSSARIRMDWSVLGLLALNPNLSNLEVDRPVLQVERKANGQVQVAGFLVQPEGDEDKGVWRWLLKQKRVLVQHTAVRWVDHMGLLPLATLERGELEMRNAFGRHRAGLHFYSDAVGQAPVQLKVDFKTPLLAVSKGRWRNWKGSAFVDVGVSNSNTLEAVLKALNWNVSVQQPAGRLWTDFSQGAIQNTVLDVRVNQLSFSKMGVSQAPFVLRNASALVQAQPHALMFKRLTGVLANQAQFGPANGGVSKTTTIDQDVKWSVQLQNVDVAQVQAVAAGVLPHVGHADWLGRLQPYAFSGVLKTASFAWKVPAGQAWAEGGRMAFESDVSFQNLTVLHSATLPSGHMQHTGFRGLSGRLQGNNTRGTWQVQGQHADVLLPNVLESANLRFDSVKGNGAWANVLKPNAQARIEIEHLEASNADGHANVKGTYDVQPQGEKVLDLQGQVMRADVSKVPQYLPLLLAEKVRHWLAGALKAGQVHNGYFEVRGKLSDFPFVDSRHPGHFKVDMPFTNGTLRYAENWPEITQVQGKAVFEGAAMHITADQASTHQVRLKNAQASIEKLGPQPSPLLIKGQGEGDLKPMLAFVNDSPVGELLHNALLRAQAQGPALVDLQLRVPLHDFKKTTVEGHVGFKGNTVKLISGMPELTGLHGGLRFSHQGVWIDALQGEALGGDVSIHGHTEDNGHIDIRANGTAKAQGLAAYLNPLFEPYLQGETPYSVRVSVRPSALNVEVDSPLQGLALKLPEPLNKQADDTLPLRVAYSMGAQGADRWAVDVGPNTAQLRAITTHQGDHMGLSSLQFALGAPLPMPSAGVQGDVRLPVLNVDTWRAVYDQISGKTSKTKGASQFAELLHPVRLRVDADQLHIGSKQFEGVRLAARTVEKRWQFDVKAKGVDGYFSWLKDKQRPEGVVLARFKTLTVPKTLGSEVKDKGLEDPVSSIPALDVRADAFSMGALKLGALTLRAVNQDREWHLQELRIDNPESTTQATGVWRYNSGLAAQTTDIEIEQTIHDTGKFLARLGMSGVFRGGESSLVGRVHWNDGPTHIDYASLGGQLRLESKKGQFLKADPGVAKLLGVLSLQGIARRFTLDFKDIFSQGFAYDTTEADVQLSQGMVSTKNLKMTAPSATVLMDGSLNLVAETQSLNVLVLPDLSPTGGSLVYSLIAANPAVGLVSLIADFVLKDPIAKVFSVQYKVGGPWSEPTVDKVGR